MKTPMAGAVGGKFGAGDVAAVGVEVEVVAGADGGVHVGQRDPGIGGRCNLRDGDGTESDGAEGGAGREDEKSGSHSRSCLQKGCEVFDDEGSGLMLPCRLWQRANNDAIRSGYRRTLRVFEPQPL